ncbi:3-isopropylmalate dehydrogenase [Streptomyces alboflavus]|uniref:3-isopropylmalate dehydrogenase n=1 Tax=Streptomyces alboflavus TaxID=67267 RepID=A0A1Z1WJQ1_9ACTN|nr:3-isopropylmalate dehydrogenase [Streptomyces alboflavus]
MAQGLKVLNAVLPQDVKLETKEYDFGARRYHASGETLTDADLADLKKHDAILLGAIGDPSVPSGVLERGFLLKLRFAFDHHVNLRPRDCSRVWPRRSRVSPRSTSWSCARAPRAPTPATAAPSARAPRTRSPPRSP